MAPPITHVSVYAAEIYAKRSGAMQLRAMNLVFEATTARGMTIVVPSAMADRLNPGGSSAILGAVATQP
ncbi:hypothetical protein [Methylovirgula sp. 4M-Z18]|uniref:hypothetical protein n=1 Tax=Methylovirgula sp. 4M-Z18 TaxID=2293567 RepID=UPI000E2ED59E|nr:hypothetical protein [Methylovirgula sp. 4M-Z18]RFB79236.1 hypothetical protein DYH55_11690 [Methylovirgula sp. 4M-Z18]